MAFSWQTITGGCLRKAGWRSFVTVLLGTIFIVTACKKHSEIKSPPSDLELQQRLVGKWSLQRNETNSFESIVTVSSNGSYVCDATGFKGPLHIEGTWKFENGYLVDTMLKHSDTNAHLPNVSRSKILVFETNIITLQHKQAVTDLMETNFQIVEATFRKEGSN